MRKFAWLTAALLTAAVLCAPALAGRGTITIATVTDQGSGVYDLALSNPADVSVIAVGDHVAARLSSGAGAVYEVTVVTTSTSTVRVTDTLYSDAESAVFGVPVAGGGAYYTPVGNLDLGQLPYAAPGWDAVHRYSFARIASRGVITQSGSASVSSATGSYAAARTVTIAANTWRATGDAVVIRANVRQAAGSGVNLRCDVAGTNCTTLTAVGLAEIWLVREDSGELRVYSTLDGATSQYARDTVSSLNFTAEITVSLEIQGGDTAGGTGTDFWVVQRVR